MWMAFKYVVTAAMLAEANFCAQNLKLPLGVPIRWEDLVHCHVDAPVLPGWGGRLDLTNYSFGFGIFCAGRLQYVHKLHTFGPISYDERNRKLRRQKSVLDKARAYRLATNWVAAMSVDVQALERDYPVEVWQEIDWGSHGQRGLLPLFHATWGPEDRPKVDVRIDGRDGSLLHVRLEDGSLSRRPPQLILQREELLAIPDSEFLAYTQAERDALVARHTTVIYTNAPPSLPTLLAAPPTNSLPIQPPRAAPRRLRTPKDTGSGDR